MKILCAFFLLLPLLACSQAWQYVKPDGGIGIDEGYAICADGSGNCYITGVYSGQAKLIKYNASGLLAWNRDIWNGFGRTIAWGQAGHLYVAGDSSLQMLCAKYDTSGNWLWTINAGLGSCRDITLDNAGHLFLTGSAIFLQKFDTSGNQIWSRTVNATSNSVCVGNSESCYLTGYFSGSTVFGSVNLIAQGTQDIFVAKYDSSGNCQWAKRAGGNFNCCYSNDYGYAIAADNAENIYVTGSIVDTVNFDAFNLIASANDIFLAKYDQNGNTLWVRQATGGSDQEGRCITIAKYNSILIGGSYVPTVTFDNIPLNGWGNYDAYVARYDSNGNFLNAITAGGAGWNEYVYGIAADDSGNTFVTGSFSYTSHFGANIVVSNGNYDVFIGKTDILTSLNETQIMPYAFTVIISPNPFRSSATFSFPSLPHPAELRVHDILGREAIPAVALKSGGTSYTMQRGNLPSGIYYYSLRARGEILSAGKILTE